MPAAWTPPPALLVDDLAFSAKIDYLTLGPYPAKTKLPDLVGSIEVVPPNRNTGRRRWLTVHDPVRDDIIALDSVLGLALVVGLEIAVDLRPKGVNDPERAKWLLEQTFLSMAARFRPEDQAFWDHSKRGAVKNRGGNVEPLERRQARLGEEVIYGGRHEDMQAKLYLKTLDHGAELPLAEHSVRMEITLSRWACKVSGIDHLADLLGYPYRKKFTTHFRVIDRPELRAAAKLDPAERERRAKRMMRAWSNAGVGKFAVGDRLREDDLIQAGKRVKARARAQLPHDQYKLIRDQRANAKVGVALMNLQRRMAR